MTSVRLSNGRILPSCCVALIKASSAPNLVELKVLSMLSNEFWKQVGKAGTRERGRVLSRFIRLMDLVGSGPSYPALGLHLTDCNPGWEPVLSGPLETFLSESSCKCSQVFF